MPIDLGGGGGGVQTDTLTAITATPAFDGTSARFSNFSFTNNHLWFWGYNADGDYVVVDTTSIEYYNNAGSLQWTVNTTDFDALADGFCAVCKEGSYIYAVAVDSGTTSAWIGKIDSAGSVSSVTSITATGNTLANFEECWLGVPEGESDIYLVGSPLPSTSFNASTLASSTTCATVYRYNAFLTSKLQGFEIQERVSAGNYNTYCYFRIEGPNIQSNLTYFPSMFLTSNKFGLGWLPSVITTQFVKFFYWDGYIIGGGADSGFIGTSNKAYTVADFDAYANSFLTQIGVYRDGTGAWS
jgi:hypothetical protein